MAGVAKKTILPSSSSSSHPAVNIPSWWQEAAEITADESYSNLPPVVVVCGPGNSGKSAFSRLLITTLLKRYKRVGCLDTDVGQPEFTAPGCLSLHIIDKLTPDITVLCLKNPERFFFYGDINCQRDTSVYLKNILSLYDYFHKEHYQIGNPEKSMLPLVVNTSGWVKGTGYDMLVKMIKHISPTHVVQIRISSDSKNLPRGKFWLDENELGPAHLIEISVAPKQSSSRQTVARKDARALRDLRLIAYFRQCLPRELEFSSYRQLAHNLASMPPHELPLSNVKFIRLHSQDSNAPNFHQLNATVVGLAISSYTPDSPEDSMPWCVSVGIVRSVDTSKDLLRVIAPISLAILEKVDCILLGSIEIPVCLSQEQGSAN